MAKHLSVETLSLIKVLKLFTQVSDCGPGFHYDSDYTQILLY